MRSVSIFPIGDASMSARTLALAADHSAESTPTAMPGLVQNCPTPIVRDAAYPFANVVSPPGITNTGFVLPISANTGIGLGRLEAISMRILPTRWEPVNPTAVM